MSDPISTQIAQALQGRLEQISTANGYHTDLGQSIWRGFWSLALDARQEVPLIAIQPDVETVESTREARTKLGITRRLVVVTDVINAAGTQPYHAEDRLEAALADIRRALLHAPGNDLNRLGVKDAITLGTAEYALAADSRYALAGLPVSISCIEHYQED
ncbi:hypothetical protein [Halomonas cerina]|uniref:Uncharacterized protein n=1 Tax=Halomonas cerina TaxID=447424 RepID=A0A839VD50_9GAMM|nr:hypothetical protein [Halomonas cerina]MBB3192048.1 hypothetical protein [Halomonas cerina]